ncbi:hypothetical protein ONZ45_g11159 [Pleurotus djamor]|nr:hypothetical protein ONZ45_g11159 [Pleurotus djamor]
MAFVSPNQQFVDIPNVAKTLPRNPLLNYTGSATAVSSTRSRSIASSARNQAQLRRRLLFHDRRSLITGDVWASLEAIHFVNDIRDKDLKEQKAEVEKILTRQCFAGLKSFKLNWMGNAALCEPNLHADLDTYGLFALVPPLEQLYDIRKHLIKHNAQWARRAAEIPKAPRELDTSEAPYVVTALELLVLYDEFLPEGQSLAILPGNFRSKERSSLETSELQSRHQHWYVYPGGRSLGNRGYTERLPAITGINARPSDDKLSIFSIIINAASKIRCWNEYNKTPLLAVSRISEFVGVVSELRDLIFFTPPTLTNTVPEGMPIPASPYTHSDPNDVTPTGSLSSGSMVPPIQHSLPVDESTPMDTREDADPLAENGDDDENGGDFDSEDDDDSDSETGSTYNLTPEEVKILGQRASDGSLSPAERADNAMLLLGMARNLAHLARYGNNGMLELQFAQHKEDADKVIHQSELETMGYGSNPMPKSNPEAPARQEALITKAPLFSHSGNRRFHSFPKKRRHSADDSKAPTEAPTPASKNHRTEKDPPCPAEKFYDPSKESIWTRLGVNAESFKRAPGTTGGQVISGDVHAGDIEKRLADAPMLQQKMKPRHLNMIAVGGSIGTGLFVSSGLALRNGGPAGILISWITIGFMLINITQALGEMSILYPVSGGFYTLAIRFLDPSFAFAMGWNYVFQWMVALPLELTVAGATIGYWTDSVPLAVWITVFWAAIFILSVFGTLGYAEEEFWASCLKLFVVVLFCIVGIVCICGGGPSSGQYGSYVGGRYWSEPGAFANGFKGVCSVFVAAAFSFAGTELVGLAASETPNPRESMPAAVKGTFWRIAIVYVTSLTIIGLLVPYTDSRLLASDETAGAVSPFVMVISNARISGLDHLINAVICVSVLSVGLSSVYAGSRTLTALAETGYAPSFFAYVDKSSRPLFSMLAVLLCGPIAYINVAPSGDTVSWAIQGHSVEELPFKALFGVYGSWFGVVLIVLVFIAQFYVAVWPIGGTSGPGDTAQSFFQAYLAVPVALLFYVVGLVWKRQLPQRLTEIDLDTGRKSWLTAAEMHEFPRLDPAPMISHSQYRLQSTVYGGRGLFATEDIPSNSLVLRCDEPYAWVIYKKFRKEVCAECFSLGSEDIGFGLWFCSEKCRDVWAATRGDQCLRVMSAIERTIDKLHANLQTRKKVVEHLDMDPKRLSGDDINILWKGSEDQVNNIRQSTPLSELELDTARFVASAMIRRWQEDESGQAYQGPKWKDLLNLQDNEEVHIASHHEVLDSWIRIYAFLRHRLSMVSSKLPPALIKLLETSTPVRAVLARDHGNVFGIFEEGRVGDEEAEMLGFGMYPEASYFNHSCKPNVRKVRRGRVMEFWTTRAIQTGQELCTNYIDVAASVEERRTELRDKWYFDCGCERCQVELEALAS